MFEAIMASGGYIGLLIGLEELLSDLKSADLISNCWPLGARFY